MCFCVGIEISLENSTNTVSNLKMLAQNKSSKISTNNFSLELASVVNYHLEKSRAPKPWEFVLTTGNEQDWDII